MSGPTRRRFLGGAALGAAGLAGCLGARLPGGGPEPDLTVYLGAYHWGFVLLDDDGAERERVVVDPGMAVRLVAFNTEAHEAIEALPGPVRDALPDHEALEERNEDRIPAPPEGKLHDALAEANERYPDHSLAVMPAGYNEMPMGGGYGMGEGGYGMGGRGYGMGDGDVARRGANQMGGGMMLHPVPLPHDAPRPAVAGLEATDRGSYTLSCLTYCGYGHPFMELPGALAVR